MNVLIFKTNIRFKTDLKIIQTFLAGYEHIVQWNVDRQDSDKVLRIVSPSGDTLEIINSINRAGYHCEELPD